MCSPFIKSSPFFFFQRRFPHSECLKQKTSSIIQFNNYKPQKLNTTAHEKKKKLKGRSCACVYTSTLKQETGNSTEGNLLSFFLFIKIPPPTEIENCD